MTLLELLVVLVLMAVSGALIMPALRLSTRTDSADEDGRKLSPVDAVIAEARRLAVRQGRPLRLKVASDGAWVLVAASDGATVRSGRISGQPDWLPDMNVDAMGGCALVTGVTPLDGATAWDALRCRWRTQHQSSTDLFRELLPATLDDDDAKPRLRWPGAVPNSSDRSRGITSFNTLA